ncbi:ABC transporter permease [Nocardioides terrisoli]|uniref:ABC transporter permease n=1 Tax=Nocardioides terrisoli TaxID=3388267 RepID=UPI00287B7EB8|nr:ABC transporter permease [Nocardioides marmorisolisilvae]
MSAMSTTSPLIASVDAELYRIRKWPAVWVTLGAWLLLSALFGYVFNYVAYRTGSNTFSNEGESASALLGSILPAAVPHTLIDGMPMFGGALMLVLGAIVAGNGYGWGTWKTVFTQGPSRRSTVLGSLGALTIFVVGVVAVTFVFDLGLSLLVAASESQAVVWPGLAESLRSMGAGFLVIEMWSLVGYLLGTLARGPALSVGLGLLWALVIENLLRGVGTMLHWVAVITHFLPGTAAGSLVGSIVGVGGPDSTPGVVGAISGERGAWTLAAYLVLLPVAILSLVRRRDVA